MDHPVQRPTENSKVIVMRMDRGQIIGAIPDVAIHHIHPFHVLDLGAYSIDDLSVALAANVPFHRQAV